MLKEYFIGVITLTLFVAVAFGVSHPRLRNAVSFGGGVLLVCGILLPIVDILQDFDVDKSLDDIFDGIDFDATDSAIELAFENGVAEHIANSYGIPCECVSVRADGFDIASLTAERIYVTLSGKGTLLGYKRVEKDVGAEFAPRGYCEVYISFG